jgi:hypothetical protein
MIPLNDILGHVPAHIIQQQHNFGAPTNPDWGQFCIRAMLVYLEGCCEMIGSRNKTVEIDESEFGRIGATVSKGSGSLA